METKTKHRILGAVVTVGIIIISIPLFQHSNDDIPTDTTVVKAPPFPDEAIQTTHLPQTAEESVAAADVNTPMPAAANESNAASNQETEQNTAEKAAPDNIDTQTTTNTPTTENTLSTEDMATPTDIEDSDLVNNKTEAVINDKLQTSEINTTTAPKKQKVAEKNKAPKIVANKNKSNHAKKSNIADDSLVNLKDPAWVVQLGSFQNKENALRLVNQLRAKGYHAFTQQTSTRFGNATRVYVGPEKQQTSARTLATRLEDDMNLRGIVLNYKPLAL
jgi:DedD protein